MKKKYSLRLQLVLIMLAFVLTVIGLVYFVQTNFLDDFYKTQKQKAIQNVANSVTQFIGDEDIDEEIEHISMTNEVCVRIVSNNEEYCYTGACTLRGLDLNTINRIAGEVIATENQEKLFDDFHYQRRFDEKAEDVYIFAKMVTYNNEKIMIMVSSGITPLNATISTLKSQYLLITAIIIVATIFLALILSYFIIRPIKDINNESKNLSHGAYDGERIRTGSLEFAQLNDTLVVANEDIQKADKAKKELLGNVSHDLRTPLTMIVGYGEMIRDLPEENNEENINVIIDEAKRLSCLVDDLIDISKIDTAGLELHKEKINVSQLLTEVYHQYDKYCEVQDIDLEMKAEAEGEIEVDVKRIKQILYNFVNNSLNYNNKEKQKIIIGSEDHNGLCRIYVYDNGEGIKTEDLDKIWDRYYKVDKEHKRHHIGSGIGLSLAKELLEAHGLKYGVESEYQEYTRFYFDVEYKKV
ncbi:MAG: HAMP domain-containing histidine kinase [Erysipelotrichaceae bacterium]|nr:HAMP domain-containing histidine kinase [Erysipelotrichaceae bacterium]MBQ6493713.1 HAMP domain-containing histidine kinase [Erysipelotrichaceae bacterium]